MNFLALLERQAGITDAALEFLNELFELADPEAMNGGFRALQGIGGCAESLEGRQESFLGAGEFGHQRRGKRGVIGEIGVGEFIKNCGLGFKIGERRLGAKPLADLGAGEDKLAEHFHAFGE